MQTAIVAYFVFALFKYRIAVLLLAPLGLFLVEFPVMDGQVFSVFDVCCIGLTALLPFKTNFISKLKTYPFLVPSICVLISYCVTNVLAEAHWPSTIFVFNTIYVYPFIVWCVLDTKKDVKWLLGGFIAFFSFCAIYALVELALDQNIIIENLQMKYLVNENVINYTEVRFGFKRLQSIFCTPMSMGLAMSAFAYVLYEKYKTLVQKDFLMFCLIILCFALPWLSGARSVFLAAIVIMFPVLRTIFKSGSFVLLKIALVGGAIFWGGAWVMTLVDSFVHSDTAVTGSSLDMRLMQFAVIVPFFLNSPIWGNGYAYTWTFVKAVDKDLLGAESIWLQVLVDFGILGAIAYIVCIVSMYKNLTRYRKDGKFLPLAVILGYTMSTFLGLELNFFFILCMILIKNYQWEDEEREAEKLEEEKSEEASDKSLAKTN
ncbi:MAG: O-antigen ligase family protein [Fibrobacter sp.]|nr:O-antigen ligase family protein [Fibrobacter sp.]